MSNVWMMKQYESAYLCYRKYTAMQLHFKDGSDYDYIKYNSNIRGTIDSFVAKPNNIKLPYVNLYNKIKSVDIDRFLFANHKHDQNTTAKSLSTHSAINIHKDWESKYGTTEVFHHTCIIRLKSLYSDSAILSDCTSMYDVVLRLLDHSINSGDYFEIIIFLLSRNQDVYEEIKIVVEYNIYQRLTLIKINRIYSFYFGWNII